MALVHQFFQLDTLTSRQITTGMGGIAKLNVKWSHLSSDMRQGLLNALDTTVRSLNDREVANLLHTFSKLQISWKDLSSSIQEGLLDSFVLHSEALVSEQGSMAIYALGLLGLQKTNLDTKVMQHIFSVAILVLSESSIRTSREVSQQVRLKYLMFPCMMIFYL